MNSNKRVVMTIHYHTTEPKHSSEIDYNYVERNYLSSFEESMKSFEKLEGKRIKKWKL